MNTTSVLEKRIAVALSSDITAANLSSLIAETETAIPHRTDVGQMLLPSRRKPSRSI